MWLTSHDVAALIGVHVGTLANWRSGGTGPAWSKPQGRKLIRYRAADVEAWMLGQ